MLKEDNRMNYQRLYSYRFKDIDQSSRVNVWQEIGPFIYNFLGKPQRVLDPAAGRCEFVNSLPAVECWAVDEVQYPEMNADKTKIVISDVMEADLPESYFDGIFVSNFLEHLPSQTAISAFLEKMHGVLRPGGKIAIMGPNYRYCSKHYWDCADHIIALTHLAVQEHLYTAGFTPSKTFPQFLPFSFRGILPPSRTLTRLYLRQPLLWRLLGKQFLVLGER